jgi:predicted small lipoprotein YifL
MKEIVMRFRLLPALMLALVCAPLAACGDKVPLGSAGTTAPTETTTPAAASKVCLGMTADQCLRMTFIGFDGMLTTIDLLIDAKVIVPGSPTALKIQARLIDAKAVMKAIATADDAVTSRQVDDAVAAVAAVTAAVKEIKR